MRPSGCRGQGSEAYKPAPDTELCAAVDIGTTTIACVLSDRVGGGIVGRIAAANRQRSYSPDVVSRIESVLRKPELRIVLQRLVRDQAGFLLDELCRKTGAGLPEGIHICGNTTMLHLWEGADLAGLGAMPFHPVFLESRSSTVKLGMAAATPCRLLPGISAFIGSDILAGIVACGLHEISGHPELLIDIGTNSEIVLATGKRLLATATAAGPAFEGATISCGLPAVDGAVDHVSWQDGRFSFTTLGGLPPEGFCGSGLLDLLAGLRRAGRMDEHGSLQVEADKEGLRAFLLASSPVLRLTQADVRQLQLAKGAIAAGIRVLCRRAGIAAGDIGRVHLAGAFGSSLSSESAMVVGLLPQEFAGRVKAEGNTALAGALRSARDPGVLDPFQRIASEVQVVELSRDADFPEAFVEARLFPALPKNDG